MFQQLLPQFPQLAGQLSAGAGLPAIAAETDAIGDIRLALDQGQPLGDSRFVDYIEKVTGSRREVRPRGRPRKAVVDGNEEIQFGLKL